MKPRVFVNSSAEGMQLAYAIQANLEDSAEVTVWAAFFSPGIPVLDALLDRLDDFDFLIAIFSSDDSLTLRDRGSSRDTLFFELGLFIGSLGRNRCFILTPAGSASLRLPTDLMGIAVASYQTDRADRNLLAALGPACESIRRVISELGRREVRGGTKRKTELAKGEPKSRKEAVPKPEQETGDHPGSPDFSALRVPNASLHQSGKTRPGNTRKGKTAVSTKKLRTSTVPVVSPLPTSPRGPIDAFFSYSHRDEKLRDALDIHLSGLKREGSIRSWHDRKITAGTEWKKEIGDHLSSADLVILLVSASFLASDFCYDDEMKKALERHENGSARVIPVILSPVDWQTSPLGKLQALPKDAKPITTWSNRQSAFLDVVRGIRRVIELSTSTP